MTPSGSFGVSARGDVRLRESRCVECGKVITGRKDRKTCSIKCRVALHRRLKGVK